MKRESFGKLLSQVSKSVKLENDYNLAKLNLTMEQARFILFLDSDKNSEIYQKDLCDYFHSTKGSVSSMLSNLEEDGLIDRAVGDDARHRQIKLTEKAERLVAQIIIELDKTEKRLLNDFSLSDAKQLFELLLKAQKNMEKQKI